MTHALPFQNCLQPELEERRGAWRMRDVTRCGLRSLMQPSAACACGQKACLLGRYMLDGAGKSMERLSMIAGGTGITPMYQVRRSPVGFVGGTDAVVPTGTTVAASIRSPAQKRAAHAVQFFCGFCCSAWARGKEKAGHVSRGGGAALSNHFIFAGTCTGCQGVGTGVHEGRRSAHLRAGQPRQTYI